MGRTTTSIKGGTIVSAEDPPQNRRQVADRVRKSSARNPSSSRSPHPVQYHLGRSGNGCRGTHKNAAQDCISRHVEGQLVDSTTGQDGDRDTVLSTVATDTTLSCIAESPAGLESDNRVTDTEHTSQDDLKVAGGLSVDAIEDGTPSENSSEMSEQDTAKSEYTQSTDASTLVDKTDVRARSEGRERQSHEKPRLDSQDMTVGDDDDDDAGTSKESRKRTRCALRLGMTFNGGEVFEDEERFDSPDSPFPDPEFFGMWYSQAKGHEQLRDV